MAESEKGRHGAAAPEERQPPLACRILCALAEAGPETLDGHSGVSLPWLGKRLGHSASVLVRELACLGDALLAGQRGPGWVRVEQKEARWTVYLTAQGLAVAQALAGGPAATGPESESRFASQGGPAGQAR